MTNAAVMMSLTSVVVISLESGPHVLLNKAPPQSAAALALPECPFLADQYRTMEGCLRTKMHQLTGLKLGYVEQLYTFGDKARAHQKSKEDKADITVGYVALTRVSLERVLSDFQWVDWYDLFPWEDWRYGRPSIIDWHILPKLDAWVEDGETIQERKVRQERVFLCFGRHEENGKISQESQWDNERVLERYELLFSANLVPESQLHHGILSNDSLVVLGNPLYMDHRRILATSMSRIRAKIKYRPVVFELMPEYFTLLHLQKVVESLAGIPIHKQNFRRLVEAQGLVQRTHQYQQEQKGRPAELFKFRSMVVLERPAPGVRSGYRTTLSH